MHSLGSSSADRKPSTIVRLQWLQWIAIAIPFTLLYGHLLPELVGEWYESSTFSYAFLIPFIAGYLLWLRGAELKVIRHCPTVQGAYPVLFAVILGLMGRAVGDSFTMRASMILALGSSIYLLLGRSFFKAVLFPFLYLGLMIPVPYVITKELVYHLRFFDATIAANALQMLGIPVYREAYFLHLPNITLEVADVCSGIASVFALFALGIFYVYFLSIPVHWKIGLVLATFPIAFVANLFRIVVVSALTYFIGPVALDMFFHRFSGTVTFLLALILLVLSGELLREKYPEQSARKISLEAHGVADAANGGINRSRPFLIGVVIFMSALYVSQLLENGRIFALPGSGLAALTGTLGPFSASEVSWKEPYMDTKAHSSLSRIYLGPEQKPIELFVGYRGAQNDGDRLYSPKLLLPERWNFAWVRPTSIDAGNGTPIRANSMLTRAGTAARLVLYWYQVSGESVAGELDHRLIQVRRSIVQGRSDGAVVRLATPVLESEKMEQAEERLRMFASYLYPELVKILPR